MKATKFIRVSIISAIVLATSFGTVAVVNGLTTGQPLLGSSPRPTPRVAAPTVEVFIPTPEPVAPAAVETPAPTVTPLSETPADGEPTPTVEPQVETPQAPQTIHIDAGAPVPVPHSQPIPAPSVNPNDLNTISVGF
jgi:hypothetical protein